MYIKYKWYAYLPGRHDPVCKRACAYTHTHACLNMDKQSGVFGGSNPKRLVTNSKVSVFFSTTKMKSTQQFRIPNSLLKFGMRATSACSCGQTCWRAIGRKSPWCEEAIYHHWTFGPEPKTMPLGHSLGRCAALAPREHLPWKTAIPGQNDSNTSPEFGSCWIMLDPYMTIITIINH